jgi:hypothetical protein
MSFYCKTHLRWTLYNTFPSELLLTDPRHAREELLQQTLHLGQAWDTRNWYSCSTFNLQPSRLDGNLESPPAAHLV